MRNRTIGIIGQGFVGSAVREGLKNAFSIATFDTDPEKKSTCNNITELVDTTDEIIFVCLPTPMKKDGQCDTRIVESVIVDINSVSHSLNKRMIAVIKSTVPPGTTQSLNDENDHIDVVFNPEFLTEANSFEDFKNQTRIIIGGPGAKKVKGMFRKPFPRIPIIVTKSETAEMVKYFTNCFLATKVIFANQMYDICMASNVDYDKVCEYALHDSRIGKSHLAVPGPDGDRGFGGHCFPKDLSAMIQFAQNNQFSPELLRSVYDINMSIREVKDWEKMLGRAISVDES